MSILQWSIEECLFYILVNLFDCHFLFFIFYYLNLTQMGGENILVEAIEIGTLLDLLFGSILCVQSYF